MGEAVEVSARFSGTVMTNDDLILAVTSAVSGLTALAESMQSCDELRSTALIDLAEAVQALVAAFEDLRARQQDLEVRLDRLEGFKPGWRWQ